MNSMGLSSFTRWNRSPFIEVVLEPMPLSESALIQTVIVVAKEFISTFCAKTLPFHRKNFRFLVSKVEILVMIFEYIHDMESCVLPATANLCFKELCLLLYQSKALLDYCFESSRIWILFQNRKISHQLHDIYKEILMVLDIFPLQDIELCEDLGEQIDYLKKQLARKKVFINPQDEAMRIRLLSFVEEFESGRIPEYVELKTYFVDRLGIQDVKSCKSEMEFLGELISNLEDDLEPSLSVLKGIVAVMHYCRFLFFGFEEDEAKVKSGLWKEEKYLISEETAAKFPEDFRCPISLLFMQDPVIVWTGQTYDRPSISEWVKSGEYHCPITRQSLAETYLVPNRALRSLIAKSCIACGIPTGSDPMETLLAVSPTRAVIEANKATGKLLIKLLSHESIGVNIVAAHELHLLAKSGKEYLAYIAEAGALPLLQRLLLSNHSVAQEYSVKVILILSMHESNKSLVMEQVGESIVHVLTNGHTTEAREDAAFTLVCLCAIHEYSARIAGIVGSVDALLRLLEGRRRGKIAAVTSLVLMSDHVDNCSKLIEAGSVKHLAEALGDVELSEYAAALFIDLVQHPLGAEAVKNDPMAIEALRALTSHDEFPIAKHYACVALRNLFP